MADREQPYDPYIPSGGNASQNNGNQRTAALQAVGFRPPLGLGRHFASPWISERRGSERRGTGSSRDGALARQQSQHPSYGTKASLRLGL